MTDHNMLKHKTKYKYNKELISFWDNLKIGHDKFVKDLKELNIKVTESGNYTY